MKIWDRLLRVNVRDKEKFQKIFIEVIKKVQEGDFSLKAGEVEEEDYYIVTEANRMNGYFIHIVPKQVYELFKEMQKKAPDEILGFSVMAGKHRGKEIRVSFFGVECDVLGRSFLTLS